MIASVAALMSAPTARAEVNVSYEIVSDEIPFLRGIEYRDVGGKHLLQDVPLPWRITVPVADALSPGDNGAELRADWRPDRRVCVLWTCEAKLKRVTVRISLDGRVLCENTLEIGNATCYGSVPHRSS